MSLNMMDGQAADLLKKEKPSRKKKYENFQFERIPLKGYEQIVKITNAKTKLLAIVAIHSTSLGPTIGGTRIQPYKTFDAALEDVLRLSKGMTYKSAVAEVGIGGAKSIIIADPQTEKTEELLESFGEALNYFEGRYIAAEDMGCTTADVAVMHRKTPYVVGLCHEKSSGDPGRYTAWGTFRGIQAVLQKIYGSSSLEGKRIAIQGLGNVGMHLIDHLFWAGADLVITDPNAEKLKSVSELYDAKTVAIDEIYDIECDVFVPCAMGAVINDDTIRRFRCKAIAGCANNQLHRKDHGEMLKERGILYAPDFVINAGGLINVVEELEEKGYNPGNPRHRTNKIFDCLLSIFEISEKNQISTNAAAISLAEYRIKYGIGKRAGSLYFHHSS